MEASTGTAGAEGLGRIETRIPARLDRLPWSRFHWVVVFGLGIVWILDGLEVTIVGFCSPRPWSQSGSGISFTDSDIGAGAVDIRGGGMPGRAAFSGSSPTASDESGCPHHAGALPVRHRADRLRLDRLVVLGDGASSPAHGNRWRVCGDQLRDRRDDPGPRAGPRRPHRSTARSGWGGDAARLASILLNARSSPSTWLATRLRPRRDLGLGILFLRRHASGESALADHPRQGGGGGGESCARSSARSARHRQSLEDTERARLRCGSAADPLAGHRTHHVQDHPKRAVLGLSLFVGQAFIYNAVTITFGITLTTYFGVGANKVGSSTPSSRRELPRAAAPRPALRHVGRRPMIAGTYLVSAAMLGGVALLFRADATSCQGRRLGAHHRPCRHLLLRLRRGELRLSHGQRGLPMEIRALAIAFFYAIGTAIGGITGPQVFEHLGTRRHERRRHGIPDRSGGHGLGGIVEISSASERSSASSRTSRSRSPPSRPRREGRPGERGPRRRS